MCLKATTEPGDTVAIEHPTYFGEGSKGHPVGDESKHGTHIHQEVDTLVAKEDPQENAYYIKPLGVVGITPVFHALHQIHIASF